MDTVEDGSASPESIDENLTDLPTTEDQLSKNRSKRKPSKTQIKHIAQGAFTPTSPNGQIPKHAIGTDGTSPNMQNLQLEKRKSNSAQHQNKYIKNEKYDNKYGTNNMEDLFNDVTQGIFRDSNTQEDQTGQTVKTFRRAKRTASGTPENATNASRSPSGRPPPCYPCGICGKVFRVPSRYDSHMLGHSKGKPFCCNTCGKMFASQDKLDRHLPVHNCDRHAAFTCETCGKVCVNWRAYLYHMKAKHTESGGKRFSCNVKIKPEVTVRKMTGKMALQKADRNASYTCETCGKVCVNWRAYTYHYRSQHSEVAGKRFSCNLCGRQFYTRHRLKNHTIGHEKGKHHCCQVCGKLFESSKKLDIHSLVHNLSGLHDQNLQCRDCGRMYTDWIPFKQHMKTHGAQGVRYPCGLCEETFSTQYEMEKHKRVHKQFQCEFCDRLFRSASVLSAHLRVHTGERPYKCGLCERDFSQSSVLKVHMKTHSKEGRYMCKLCGGEFLDVMDYFNHHMAHLEEGNLQCEECGKMFDNINNKNRHMAAHRDRSGRQCHVCGKEFGRVSHLEAHMLCHSDQLPLLCKVCGKMFSSQEVLTAHYSTHMTGDISSDIALSNQGPLFCGICGKMFKDQEFLTKHMKKHEKEAPKTGATDKVLDEDVVEVEKGKFSCGDCGKSFGKADHLAVHRRQHTGECPHSCCMCGKSFMLRNQLLKHIREHRKTGIMYLNLSEGEICTTDDIKDVSLTSQLEELEKSSEMDINFYHEESTPKPPKISLEDLQQQPLSIESQAKQLSTHQQLYMSQPQNQPLPPQPMQDRPQPEHQHTNHHPHPLHHPHQSSSHRLQQQKQHQHQYNLSVTANSPPVDSRSSDNLLTSNIGHLHSPIPLDGHHLIAQSQVSRQAYFEAASNNPLPTSIGGVHAHPSKGGNYKHRDLLVPHAGFASPVMHLPVSLPVSVKNENDVHANMQMLKPRPQLPVRMQLSTHQDLRPDKSNPIPMAYSRPYITSPNMSNIPSHAASLHPNFHVPPSRIHPDLYHNATNFQLLPQTAFPENSHHL